MFFYIKENSMYYVYDSEKGTIEENISLDIMLTKDNKYHVLKSFVNDEDDMLTMFKKYSIKFLEMVDEIKKAKAFDDPINYTKHYSDYIITINTFKRFCAKKELMNKILNRKIKPNELIWIESCHNGGFVHINKEIVNKKIKCYGYDYSGFYPWLLTMVDIPISEGKEYILKSIDEIDVKKPAFYKIDIKYSNKNLEKIFMFNKNRIYTHYQVEKLLYAHNHYKQHFKKGDITITLIQDGEPNAYIYNKFVNGEEIFGTWYKYMSLLKKELPKNALVKWLTTSLHGQLEQSNKKYVSRTEFNEKYKKYKFLNINFTYDKEGNDIYYCIDIDDPARYGGFYVLKSFVTGLGRKMMSHCITTLDKSPTLENLVRVYCDGVVFSEKVEYKPTKYFKLLQKESKTTGRILWESSTSFYNYTLKEGHGRLKNGLKE